MTNFLANIVSIASSPIRMVSSVFEKKTPEAPSLAKQVAEKALKAKSKGVSKASTKAAAPAAHKAKKDIVSTLKFKVEPVPQEDPAPKLSFSPEKESPAKKATGKAKEVKVAKIKVKAEKVAVGRSMRNRAHKQGFYNEKNQTLKAWVKGKGTAKQPYVIM